MRKTKDMPFSIFPGEKGGLRRQILTFTMAAFFVGTLAIVLSLLQTSRIIMRKNRTESTLEQISHTAYVVEQDLNAVQELMDYFFVDKQLQAALEQPVETAYDRTLQWNQLYSALSTYERLDCFREINCILIYNADGYAHSFRYKAVDTSAYLQRNQVLGWYRAALENEGRLVWGTDVSPSAEDYAAFDQKLGADISAMRALRVQSYKRIQGAVYLSIEPTCLSLLRPSNGLREWTISCWTTRDGCSTTARIWNGCKCAGPCWKTPPGTIRNTAAIFRTGPPPTNTLCQPMATVCLSCKRTQTTLPWRTRSCGLGW